MLLNWGETMVRNVTKGTVGAAFFVLALVVVGVASASGKPGAPGYAGVAGTVQSALQTKPGSNLPFTGADLSIFVGVALVLGLVGFMMRRAGREQA
jgi:hypothetical protein